MEKIYYTLAEANALLPFVRNSLERAQGIKAEIAAMIVQIREEGIDFETLFSRTEMSPEEALYRKNLEDMGDQINDIIFEFEEKGIYLKNLDLGLIDFLARINNEDAFLCFKQGELEIAYWHTLQEGFPGRKSLFERGILENVAQVH